MPARSATLGRVYAEQNLTAGVNEMATYERCCLMLSFRLKYTLIQKLLTFVLFHFCGFNTPLEAIYREGKQKKKKNFLAFFVIGVTSQPAPQVPNYRLGKFVFLTAWFISNFSVSWCCKKTLDVFFSSSLGTYLLASLDFGVCGPFCFSPCLSPVFL